MAFDMQHWGGRTLPQRASETFPAAVGAAGVIPAGSGVGTRSASSPSAGVITEARAVMPDDVNHPPDWRNRAVEKECACGVRFTGKYNSRTCPECKEANRLTASQRFKESNPTYWRDWTRRTNGARKPHLKAYGMVPADYARMLAAQSGGCAVCGATSGWRANGGRLVVDHDHGTGVVRGLLCPPCNRGIGQFSDDAGSLRAAAEYLDARRDGTTR